MTHGGGYRPCSRTGLDACPSPLLKMSFETATVCLTDATLRGATDDLASPSSRLVLGRVVELGTGACSLQFDLSRAQRLHAERLTRVASEA
jgi:DNA-directed RNA polymerase I subunit RPA1